MKLDSHKKFKVLLSNIIPPFSNEEMCSKLLEFLNECEEKKIGVQKIVFKSTEVPYVLFFTMKDTELNKPYIVTEEIELM